MQEGKAAKVVLITGAAQGLGWASAQVLASRGYTVAIADINEEAAHRAAQELERTSNARAAGFYCDVSKKADVDALFTRLVDTLGGIDVLVSNAGTVTAAYFTDMTEEEFDSVLGIHLKGSFLCGQAAAKLMIRQNESSPGRGGAIVNTSSICGQQASDNIAHYHAAKGGIESLTRSMAVALAQHSIRVNAVAPGLIQTAMSKMIAESDTKYMPMWLSRMPMGRLGEPEEIGKVVAFLAGDDSSYITGQTLYADGGLLALNFTVPVQNPGES